jgi:hypothetical protein
MMKPKSYNRTIVGGLIWIVILSAFVYVVRQTVQQSSPAVKQLTTFATRQRRTIQLDANFRLPLDTGDPVYLANNESATPIGVVSSISVSEDLQNTAVTVSMFGNCPPITDQDHFDCHYAPDSFDWMLRTMFSESKKKELKTLIQAALQENQVEIAAAFKPVIVDSLQKAGGLIQEDLKAALAKRQPQLKKLADRYQKDLLKEKLVPVFQEEVWPIIQTESEPLVSEISREIWAEVSVFGFGWRFLYDKSPLPDRNLTERKFKQFVDDKAKPIIAGHGADFVELQKAVAAKVVTNKKVQQSIRDSVETVSKDPAVQALLADVFKEVLVNNTRLHESLANSWNSPAAKRAYLIANKKLDPVIREIGVSLFGSPKEGITPEFAKVLRRRILYKDSKWLTLHIADGNSNADIDRNAPFPTTLPVNFSTDDTSVPIAVPD